MLKLAAYKPIPLKVQFRQDLIKELLKPQLLDEEKEDEDLQREGYVKLFCILKFVLKIIN